MGVRGLGWGERGGITNSFPLDSNGRSAFRSVTKEGKKLIYGLKIPDMFVNFNKSH